MSTDKPVYYTLDEVAQMLRLSPRTLLNRRRRPGALPPVTKLPGGRSLLFEQNACKRWIAGLSQGEVRSDAERAMLDALEGGIGQ